MRLGLCDGVALSGMFRPGDGAFSERGSVYRSLSRFSLPLDVEATPTGACVGAATGRGSSEVWRRSCRGIEARRLRQLTR